MSSVQPSQLFDKDAEMACLGAMILQRDLIPMIVPILSPDDFYFPSNQILYKTIIELDAKGVDIDLLTITSELRNKGLLEDLGGESYLAEVFKSVQSTSNIMSYARIVKEKSLLRRIVASAHKIIDEAYSGNKSPDDIIEDAESLFFSISRERESKDLKHIKDILVEAFEKIEALTTRSGEITGIPTGFRELDRLTTGFHGGELIIVGARPSTGKTTFGINIATHMALREGKTVAIFILEMRAVEIAMRILASESRIPYTKISTGRLSKQDLNLLAATINRLSDMNLFIDDTTDISVYELRSKARRLKSQYGLDFILVDYLQLLSTGRKSGERHIVVAEISRVLKTTAMELDVPVLAISQLSREAERRDGPPILSDLRESGAIEQDADIVMFIHREDLLRREEVEEENIADIIIAKQRNGPIGRFKLAFVPEYVRFEDIAFEREEDFFS